ncbi:response regulator [Falsiroseomonas stagni]|uniref:Response regulator receiver domain-containing protein n=1 Tax=Falsiroseomonas stagni DSM 19981 TaxID=1123062 RepID=A0A1I3Z0G5_9PROT|nr:response regulator [Falsiroseomonas stagni]SFK37553.1 Response regulator receiver domain-containing protein [Falsiroseomonas stagni DSM 19981]
MALARHVLLVEDDPLVRMTLVEGLSDSGFAVLEAEDAEMALRMLARHPEIALLLTDINLPGADGFALARAARVLRPDLPVVYASGRFRQAEPGRGLAGAPFLAKPFSVACAAATIAGAMRALG